MCGSFVGYFGLCLINESWLPTAEGVPRKQILTFPIQPRSWGPSRHGPSALEAPRPGASGLSLFRTMCLPPLQPSAQLHR